jgi:DNA primase
MEKIVQKAHRYLKEGKQTSKARSYLNQRAVEDQHIDQYTLGYFPPSIDVFDTLSFDSPVWRRFKSRFQSHHLSNKLVFPVTDAVGDVVGIHVRTPSFDLKDYMKFYVGRSSAAARFFGTDRAMPYIWKHRSIVLCEGLFDLFPIARITPLVLCTLTASMSEADVRFLQRYVDDVYLAPDNDEQGERMADIFEYKYGSHFTKVDRVRFRGDDLSECWSSLGDSRFSRLISNQIPTL